MIPSNLATSTLAAASILAIAVGCGGDGQDAKTKAMVNHVVEASKALKAGDKAAAMEALDASIAEKPTVWALFHRARLYVDEGKVNEAIADCETGLELNPDDRNLKWQLGELNKPEAKRFQGKNAEPPVQSL